MPVCPRVYYTKNTLDYRVCVYIYIDAQSLVEQYYQRHARSW